MRLSNITTNELTFDPEITNKNFSVSGCLSQDYQPTRIPNVEFGKSYYTQLTYDGITSVYAVKFYGITFGSYGMQKVALIGEVSNGDSIQYGTNCCVRIYNKCTGNETTKTKGKLYASVKDYNNKIAVEETEYTFFKCRLINYLFPRKFKFHKQSETNIFAFRYAWDGVKSVGRCESINDSFVVFFEKPKMNNIWVRMGEYRWSAYTPLDIERILGKICVYDGKLDPTTTTKIYNFFAKTYGTRDECLEDNETEVHFFDGEEEEQEKKVDSDMVYLALVGLITKDQAKELLKELKSNKIK